jgi:hypothetical protein
LLAECLRRLLDDESDPIGAELRGRHLADCDKACYRCLMRYGNQPWHGILDWRLGMIGYDCLGDSNGTPSAPGTDRRQWGPVRRLEVSPRSLAYRSGTD